MTLSEERASQLMDAMDTEFYRYKLEKGLDIPMDKIDQLFQLVPNGNDVLLRFDNSLVDYLSEEDKKHFRDYFNTL